MMQYHGGQSGRLTDDLVHGIECDPGKSVGDMHKYVRSDPVQDDLKSYDHGKFNFAIANMPSEFANKQERVYIEDSHYYAGRQLPRQGKEYMNV